MTIMRRVPAPFPPLGWLAKPYSMMGSWIALVRQGIRNAR